MKRQGDGSIVFARVSQSDTLTYAYTNGGLLSSVSDGTGSVSYAYNAKGQQTAETVTGTSPAQKNYTYDADGNPSGVVISNGGTVYNQSYTYNHIGQLTTVRDNLSSKNVASYTYDGAGNISTKTLANGVTTAYTYNGTNFLSSVTNKKGNIVLSSYAYTYYLDGNRASVTDQSGNIHSYTYDKLGQLKVETDTKNGTVTSYTYDGNGNRITKDVSGSTSSSTQYTYDANNRLTKESCNDTISVTEHDYYYDNNGNLITKTVSMYTDDTGEFEQLSIGQYPLGYTSSVDGALATSYGYNLRNMLTSIETDTGLQTEYLYNASGARAKKTVTGVSTSYIWNGSNMVYEKGKNTAYYCYGDGIISMVNADGAYYHLKNGHGDVTQLTTSSGTIAEDYVYDAFGNQEDADHTIDNPFRYCGEYFDEESGFIYLRNRYYDSATGRFITEDPVKDGLNWYAYCHSDPVNFNDPFGLEEDRDKHVLTKEDYEKIQMLTAIYNYAVNNLKDMAIADEAHRQAVKIRQQEKYSNYPDYGPPRPATLSNILQYVPMHGAVDNYIYSRSKATVTIVIGKPLSEFDAQTASGEWIDSFSDSGGFAIIGDAFGASDVVDIAGSVASEVNSTFNPLYRKVSKGDVITTVYKKQFFNNKTIMFYFKGEDKQRCYYVKGD